MEEKWINNDKKEIYFLEWLAQASGFSEEQILENMKPENQKWEFDISTYYSLKEYLKSVKIKKDHVAYIFDWKNSFLKSDNLFWAKLSLVWCSLLNEYSEYRIKFSRYKIDNSSFEIIDKLNTNDMNTDSKKIKVKEKKLKI